MANTSAIKPTTRDTDAPPTDGEPIHLAKSSDRAWCGLKIDKWVSMAEWSNKPCRCCVTEAMDGK